MDKKKQRIISVIIGLILAGLILFIAVRVIQRRASQASQPESITAERTAPNTCKVSMVTKTDEPQLIRYGEVSPTFFYRFDSAQITPGADGRYTQEATIDQIGEGRITIVVENYENISTTCDPYSGSAGSTDTKASDSIVPTTAPEPTVAEEATPTPEVTAVPTEAAASVDLQPLPLDKATAFFTANDSAFIGECVGEFADQYVGLAQTCGEAYQQTR